MVAYEKSAVPVMLDGMKMLFWRLDLLKRSFINLNTCPVGVLGQENYRFFKDREYRERVLFPEDRVSMEYAFASFKDRDPVRVVFRVQGDNLIHWFKLTGWPTEDNRYYEGSVEDISEHISWLKNIFDQQSSGLLNVDGSDYPVAIFSGQGAKLLNANNSFRSLLGVDVARYAKYQLSDLIKSEIKLPLLLENLFVARRLEVDLLLTSASRGGFKASCLLECFAHGGEKFLRLAVVDLLDQQQDLPHEAQPHVQRQEVKTLCRELTKSRTVDEMLERILAEKGLFPGMDVIMFSDIYARKNKVFVYSRGEMLEPLEQGSQFPYAGTIAENIEKEHLECLIVDDTQSSIKAIDWMLFVPKGIYSYIAKALYVRGAMRTVLIFCSRGKNVFTEDHVVEVTEIATAFHRQLKQIRRGARQPAGSALI